eukprot:1323739-Prorocentrum_lima.AAC.1
MEVMRQLRNYRDCVIRKGRTTKASVANVELVSIMFMAGNTLKDIQYEMLFPELQYDDPDRPISAMRSFD